ncbi:hypothetical protein Ga0100231_005125 [Opitutaceae bacterium TAV4]|nr:hypothetical protein Ga0100231_005125 [Opitutaceae bacterium TAV4]RRK02374.1 hypothetical protein Ga0100230_004255 [Opitutaceae bacterium TAV3]
MIGQKWKVVVNGKRAINGTRHSITRGGDVAEAEEGTSVFDVVEALLEDMEPILSGEMEIIDSIQITIFPPNTASTEHVVSP